MPPPLDLNAVYKAALLVADEEGHLRLSNHLPVLYVFNDSSVLVGISCHCGRVLSLVAWKSHIETVWRDA